MRLGKLVFSLLVANSIYVSVLRAQEAQVLPNYTLRYSATTSAMPQTVWAVWEDVENWKEFDTLLEYSYLDPGNQFVSGATGAVKARGNLRTRFKLFDVKPGVSFTEKLYVPLWQTIDLKRHVERDQAGKTVFTHEVVFRGSLRFLIYAAAAKTFKKDTPVVMGRLKEVAERREAASKQQHSNLLN